MLHNGFNGQMTSDTLISAAVPTIAVLIAVIRNETSLKGLEGQIQRLDARIQSLETRLDARIQSLESRMDQRIETLDRDLREWARIVMNIQSDVEVLKSKRP